MQLLTPIGITGTFGSASRPTERPPPQIALLPKNAPPVAVSWIDGKVQTIPLEGAISSTATGVNELGAVCGRINGLRTGGQRAFLWQDGQTMLLPQPADATKAEAHGLNDVGDVCGVYRLPIQDGLEPRFGVLWSAGEMIELGVLPGFERSVALSPGRGTPSRRIGKGPGGAGGAAGSRSVGDGCGP